MTIAQEKLGDALDATENFLLVPAPIGQEKAFPGGFISQVVEAFPDVAERISEYGGVGAGAVLLVGHEGHESDDWLPAYTLAIAGIHYPENKDPYNGWNETPDLLRAALSNIKKEAPPPSITIATAGIPGTHHNKAGSTRGIEMVLDSYPLDIVVYRRRATGSPARQTTTGRASVVSTPKAYSERHPTFSNPIL